MGNTPCYAGHSVPKPYPLLPPGHRALTQGNQDTCWGPAGGLLDGERVSCATFLFLFQLLPRAGAKPQQTQLHAAACGEGEHRAREEEQELRGQFPALGAHKALLPGPAPAAGPILAPCMSRSSASTGPDCAGMAPGRPHKPPCKHRSGSPELVCQVQDGGYSPAQMFGD